MKKLLFFGLLTIAGTLHAQTNLYVDSAIAASGAGTSWTSAYKSLTEALYSITYFPSSAKYTIHVAKGTYFPTGSASGLNRDSTFLIARDGVKLLGGYPNGGGTRNATANPVILSGNIGSASDSSDNSYHVMVIGGITTNDTVVIDGFTISGGTSDSYQWHSYYSWPSGTVTITRNQGVGLNVSGNQNNIYLVNCRFSHNTSIGYSSAGGGVFAAGSILSSAIMSVFSMSGCTFDNNVALRGGGAFFTHEGCTCDVTSCLFAANRAAVGGGLYGETIGIPGAASVLRVSNTTFTNNIATNAAGGMYNEATHHSSLNYAATIAVSGCTFSGNAAIGYGGGGMEVRVSGETPHMLTYDSCTFSGNSAGFGGGMDMENGSPGGTSWPHADCKVTRCNFLNNTAAASGGGFYSSGFYPFLNVRGCRLEHNTAPNGGGIYLQFQMNTVFDSCLIRSNTAIRGGGVYTWFGLSNVPTISRCIVSGNTASFGGGGVYNAQQGYFGIESTVISGNYAGSYGGAVFDSACLPVLASCTLSGDSALFGRGVYTTASANQTIYNCIVWEGSGGIVNSPGSSSSVTYSTIQGGYTGTGNISANPQFLNPVPASNAPTTSGDYQITGCSPAIDAGTLAGLYSPGVVDILGRLRPNGVDYDNGAYEYYTPTISGPDTVCAGTVFQLSASLQGGTWSSTNASVATVSSSGLVTSLAPGVDTIVYYITGTCPTTIIRRIVVKAQPALSVTQAGAQLTANQSGAGYQWIDCANGNTPIGGQTAQTFTATANGQYAVIVTLGACSDTSGCFTVSGLSVSAWQLSQPFAQLHPNPVSGLLTIESFRIPGRITLSDMAGRQLQTMIPAGVVTALDLSRFPTGVYQLECVWGTERIVKRVNVVR